MAYLANLLVRIGVDAGALSKGLDKASWSVRKFGDDLQSAGMVMGASISLPLAGLGVAALKAAGEVEQARTSFLTMTKSVQLTNTHLAELRQFALTTPFQFEELLRASRLMQAYGFAIEDVIPKLTLLGDTASALGGGADVLERMIRSVGEIGTRGKVTGEQIRELSKVGVPIWESLAKRMGVSMAEAARRVKEGTIDAKQAFEAVFAYMEERFGGGMAAQAKTILGLWSNVKDAIFFTLSDIGEGMVPIAKQIVKENIQPALQKIRELAAEFRQLPDVVQKGTLALSGLAVVGPLAAIALGATISNIVTISSFLPKLRTAFVGVAASIGSAFIPALQSLATATWGAHAALTALGGTTILTGVAAAGIALYTLGDRILRAAKAKETLREADAELVRSTQLLATGLRQQGISTKELDDEYNHGLISFEKYRLTLMMLALGHGELIKKQNELKNSAKSIDPEDLKKAFSAIGVKDARAELTEFIKSLNLLRSAGVLTAGMLQQAYGKYKDLLRQVREQATGVQGAFGGQSFDLNALQQPWENPGEDLRPSDSVSRWSTAVAGLVSESANLARATAYIKTFGTAWNTELFNAAVATDRATRAIQFMQEATRSADLYQGLLARTMADYTDKLNITTSAGLKTRMDEHIKYYEFIKEAARSSSTDILKAEYAKNEAVLAYYRDMAYGQTKEDRKKTEKIIENLEEVQRANREKLDKIEGDHARKTRDMGRFWSIFGRQVSTIINDLARSITDLLWPRNTGGGKDAEAVTKLGLAAGVTGKQLDDLVAVVEQLALATGESFSSVAQGAADVFRGFGVSVDQQIPTLRTLYGVVKVTGIGLDELLSGLVGGAEVFRGMGLTVDQSAAMLGNWDAAGIDTSKTVDVLSSALKKLKEQGYSDAAGALRDIIQKIKDAGSVSEANAIAVRHFGNDGAEMARIIREGRLDIGQFTEAMEAASSGMGDAAGKAKELTNEGGRLKKIFEEVGRSILRAFVETGITDFLNNTKLLSRAWDGILGALRSVGEWLGIIGKKSAETGLNAIGTKIGDLAGTPAYVPGVGGVAGEAGGTAAGSAGGAGSAAGGLGGAMGAINMVSGIFTAIGSFGSFIQGLTSQVDKDVGIITRSVIKIELLTLGSVETFREYLPKLKDIHGWLWEFTGWFASLMTTTENMAADMARVAASVAGGYQFATVPATSYGSAPVSNVSNRGGDTYHITVDGRSATATDDVKEMFREGARMLRNRGTRHITGIR